MEGSHAPPVRTVAPERRLKEAEYIDRIIRAHGEGDYGAMRDALCRLLDLTGGELPPIDLPSTFGSHLRHGSSWIFAEVGS